MFRIETANWEKRYPLYSKQKKEVMAKTCLHLSKFHGLHTFYQGEMAITMPVCGKCRKVLDPNDIAKVREYEQRFL